MVAPELTSPRENRLPPKCRAPQSRAMRPRRMVVVDQDLGPVEADVVDDETASLIGRHHAAMNRYLATGDDSRLQQFRGVEFQAGGQRYRPATDPPRIEDFA